MVWQGKISKIQHNMKKANCRHVSILIILLIGRSIQKGLHKSIHIKTHKSIQKGLERYLKLLTMITNSQKSGGQGRCAWGSILSVYFLFEFPVCACVWEKHTHTLPGAKQDAISHSWKNVIYPGAQTDVKRSCNMMEFYIYQYFCSEFIICLHLLIHVIKLKHRTISLSCFVE